MSFGRLGRMTLLTGAIMAAAPGCKSLDEQVVDCRTQVNQVLEDTWRIGDDMRRLAGNHIGKGWYVNLNDRVWTPDEKHLDACEAVEEQAARYAECILNQLTVAAGEEYQARRSNEGLKLIRGHLVHDHKADEGLQGATEEEKGRKLATCERREEVVIAEHDKFVEAHGIFRQGLIELNEDRKK